MKSRKSHLVERESGGERSHRHAVTGGAGSLAVARAAKIPHARGAHAMFANEISVVDEMARRRGLFGCHVHVTAVAVSRHPLLLVSMTTEAGRHFRPQCFGLRQADLDVTAHAFPARRRHMRSMAEPKVVARNLSSGAHVRFAVAVGARARIVGLHVAAQAISRAWKMNGSGIVLAADASVALEAVDAAGHVGTVLERVPRLGPNPENAGARCRGHDDDEEDRGSSDHGTLAVA